MKIDENTFFQSPLEVNMPHSLDEHCLSTNLIIVTRDLSVWLISVPNVGAQVDGLLLEREVGARDHHGAGEQGLERQQGLHQAGVDHHIIHLSSTNCCCCYFTRWGPWNNKQIFLLLFVKFQKKFSRKQNFNYLQVVANQKQKHFQWSWVSIYSSGYSDARGNWVELFAMFDQYFKALEIFL